MEKHRHRLWLNIMEDLGPPEGCVISGWLVCVYMLLFPFQGLTGLLIDTWALIHFAWCGQYTELTTLPSSFTASPSLMEHFIGLSL